MIENPFYAFVHLVELDQKVEQRLNQKEKLQTFIDQEHQRVQEEQLVVAAQCAQSHDLRKQITHQELEHKSLQNQEKKIRLKLDNVNTSKEYTALEHELQVILEQEEKKEEEIFSLWAEFEKLGALCHAAEKEFKLFVKKSEEEIKNAQEKIESLDQEVRSLGGQRPEYIQKAPPEFIEKYESMCKSVKNPVVSLVENGCGVCATQLMNSDLSQLRRHVLIPCKTCYRLLYMK